MIRARHILVVTPAPDACRELKDALERSGSTVDVVTALAGRLEPDLAVVDLAHGADLWPVADILSSGRLVLLVADATDLSRGFSLGADDCVMAGAATAEVVARCEASLRRTAHSDSAIDVGQPSIYADGRLWVNFALRQVWVGDRSAHLTTREQRLLAFLIRRSDTTVSHEDILTGVWRRAPKRDLPTEVLKQYVWRLRQKLEDDPARPEIIVTIPGEGYKFVSHPG